MNIITAYGKPHGYNSCFFSSPKTPNAPPPPPAPAAIAPPPPTPVTAIASQSSADDRRKRIQNLRFGLSSTIKTGPRGIVGAGPELQSTTGAKTTLG